jgi:hypothetical protein
VDRATRKVFVGLGAVAPVGARVGDGVEVADRDRDPEIIVTPAGLEQQHPVRRILRQAIGEQAAGAARADDDEIVAPEVLQAVSPAVL